MTNKFRQKCNMAHSGKNVTINCHILLRKNVTIDCHILPRNVTMLHFTPEFTCHIIPQSVSFRCRNFVVEDLSSKNRNFN